MVAWQFSIIGLPFHPPESSTAENRRSSLFPFTEEDALPTSRLHSTTPWQAGLQTAPETQWRMSLPMCGLQTKPGNPAPFTECVSISAPASDFQQLPIFRLSALRHFDISGPGPRISDLCFFVSHRFSSLPVISVFSQSFQFTGFFSLLFQFTVNCSLFTAVLVPKYQKVWDNLPA